jgi:hypothetical protein
MSLTFRKAVREQTSVLLALAGSSGSGKTFSALRIARGLAGGGKIACLDTEAGRMLHYADRFDFDHADLAAPFTPDAYRDAIKAASSLDYRVIVIDSWSHVWSGEGGVSEQHDEALHAMVERAKKRNPNAEEWQLHDALNGPAWRCKIPYKAMVQRLLQCRAHLVFCLRAEPKIKFVKDPKTNKTNIVDAGWQPICEKNFMYEMTASFMLSDDAPGIGKPTKLQAQHKSCFPDGALLDESAGERLAAWASGGAKREAVAVPVIPIRSAGSDSEGHPERQTSGRVTTEPSLTRAALLSEITALADAKKLKSAARGALWEQHVGVGVDSETAPLDKLTKLRDELATVAA